jgi:hypothetical protein
VSGTGGWASRAVRQSHRFPPEAIEGLTEAQPLPYLAGRGLADARECSGGCPRRLLTAGNWHSGSAPTLQHRRGSTQTPLDDANPALVVIDAVTRPTIVAQEVTHLAHRAGQGKKLRGQEDLCLDVTAIEAIEARVGLVEAAIDDAHPVAKAPESSRTPCMSSRMPLRIAMVTSVGCMWSPSPVECATGSEQAPRQGRGGGIRGDGFHGP